MSHLPENIWYIAAIWMGLAFIASLISIRVGISVALIEIVVGFIVGNIHFGNGAHILQTTDWTNFLAMLGSGVLTFLAGAEIDPVSLRANLRASLTIGFVSFLLPFAAVWLFAQFVLGWPLHQAQIAGIALSTTSVAVVYAVMIEGGLGQTPMGKTILAACFITDFGMVLALGTLFADFNWWLVVFIVVTAVMLWFMPVWTQYIITRLGASRVSEPEVKFIFLVLFFLGGLASTAKSEAVLPAYLVGLVVAGVFLRDKTLVHRMRSIAFTIFTPFYLFTKILVGYDGSKGGKAALKRAAVAAKNNRAQLTAIWVRQPLPRHADLPGESEGEAEAAADYFEERKREVAEVAKQHDIAIACESRAGHAARIILNFAREGGYDLIVIGHSDHSELWGRLLGDTADRIADHAHCSVLIVK